MVKNIIPMNITVDDGSRRVPIQNIQGEVIGEFTFHPTDLDIISRYNAMVDEFAAITQPLENLRDGDEGGEDELDHRYLEAEGEAKARLYAAVDKLLGSEGASQAFFGKMNPFSPVGGLFYCEAVLKSVGEYISAQFDMETAKFKSRAAKYLKK